MVRSLLVTVGFSAIMVMTSAAVADQTFKICQGNGGGPDCNGAGILGYTCDQFNVSFSGKTNAEIKKKMGEFFCTYTENGNSKVWPYSVVAGPSVGGGQCGWGIWTVTCAH